MPRRHHGSENETMNRRSFLRTSGISLGVLIMGQNLSSRTAAGEHECLALPDAVQAIGPDGPFPLSTGDRQRWSAHGVDVMLTQRIDDLAVDLRSPEAELRTVVLIWKHNRASGGKFLGDQWERSYADLHWGPIDGARIMPWYFMEWNSGTVNGFGVRTGCNALCYWQVSADELRLTLDVRSGGTGVLLGERTLRAAEIVTRSGKEGESAFTAMRAFCRQMCPRPRLWKTPVYGINDWYFAYGQNSAALILDHVALMAPLAAQNAVRPYCVIDAGWYTMAPTRPADGAWGDDFTRANERFGDMAALAGKIVAEGMRPGLWVRPLCARASDPDHLLLPKIPGRDAKDGPILDPTIPENLERIAGYLRLYHAWGYEMVKHDFTSWDIFGKWGRAMISTKDVTTPGWHFADRSKTTAEVVLGLYRAIREGAGAVCLIGCNTLSHLSAGIHELQRIGDDTSGREWDRTWKYGVNTLGFRIAHHDTFYAADADCVGLTTKVPWEKNRQWMQLVAESGTPLFISAQREAVGTEQREAIRQSFASAATVNPPGEPLDWMESATPSHWRLAGREVTFNWA
jgi:alpha-galactosidase